MSKTKILGRQVYDRITGFAGIATSVMINLDKHRSVYVEPVFDADNPIEGRWIDASRLEDGEAFLAAEAAEAADADGDREADIPA